MKFEAIIWDFDGVVSKPDGETWSKHIETLLGISVMEFEQIHLKPQWQTVLAGDVHFVDLLQSVLPELDFKGAPEEFLYHWFEWGLNIDDHLIEIIQHLSASGTLSYLGTNQDLPKLQYLSNMDVLKENFVHIFASCTLGALKPAPAFFNAIQASLDINASDKLLLVDDKLRSAESARALGWQAIHYQSIESLQGIVS